MRAVEAECLQEENERHPLVVSVVTDLLFGCGTGWVPGPDARVGDVAVLQHRLVEIGGDSECRCEETECVYDVLRDGRGASSHAPYVLPDVLSANPIDFGEWMEGR